MNIGNNIKKTRKLKAISQKDLADKTGLSVTALLNYEKNYRIPTVDTLQDIAQNLKVEIPILTNWTGNIITDMDVFRFISNFYPSKFYDENESIYLLKDLLNTNHENANNIRYGIFYNEDLCIKFGELFDLTVNQIQSWILSDKIGRHINNNFKFDFINSIEITEISEKKLIGSGMLKYQSIHNLFEYGLSTENKDIIDEYISNALVFSLNNSEANMVNSDKIEKCPILPVAKVTNFDYGIELVFKTDNTVDGVYEYICGEITIDELLSKVNPCDKETIKYFHSIGLLDKATSVNKVKNLETPIEIKRIENLPQKAIDEINEYLEFIKHKYEKDIYADE